MKLQNYIRYDSEAVRKMNYDEIFELHRATYKVPDGLDYDGVVKRMKFMMMKLQLRLTEEQLHFVLCCGEGVPVVAESCPGSGKTTVSQFIIFVDYMIHKIDPMKMLLTSFSNQSSVSMQEKNIDFARKLGVEPVSRIKTMHSWYFSFLKQYIQNLGLPPQVTELQQITSDKEVYRLLGSSYKQVTGERYVTDSLLSKLHAVYNYMHDGLLTTEELQTKRLFIESRMEIDVVKAIFTHFDNTKRQLGQVDFTDMQVLFYKLISTNVGVRNKISGHFDLILIDEVQDTSKLQLAIYTLLVGTTNRARFRIIGDNDQRIYGWRGASKTPFEDFFRNFNDAMLVTLGFNMRSANNIIEPANKLIRHTKNRVDKNMVSPRNLEGKTDVVACKSRLDAVQKVYLRLEQEHKKIGNDYTQMKEHCVLVRNHNQAMWLVDSLLANRIPVKLTGGKFPYQDKIIVDMLSIMTAVSNPTNVKEGANALPKIMKDLKVTDNKQVLMQMNVGKKLYEVDVAVVPTKFNPNPTFRSDMQLLTSICQAKYTTVSQLCQALIPLYKTGSYDFYAKKNSVDAEHSELIFEYLLDQNMSVDAFSVKMQTINEQLTHNNRMDLGFRISSMHTSKGLEYDNVYILDSSSRSCPNEKTLKDYTAEDAFDYLIEERNLYYVAITRARYNLMMTYNMYYPSIFNMESGLILEEHIKYVNPLPKHLANYIYGLENNIPAKSNTSHNSTNLQYVEEMAGRLDIPTKSHRTGTNTANNSKISRRPDATFTLDTRLNKQYSDIFNSLKF